jgi:hypothetical protein
MVRVPKCGANVIGRGEIRMRDGEEGCYAPDTPSN